MHRASILETKMPKKVGKFEFEIAKMSQKRKIFGFFSYIVNLVSLLITKIKFRPIVSVKWLEFLQFFEFVCVKYKEKTSNFGLIACKFK
jgi:hypothetical protein